MDQNINDRYIWMILSFIRIDFKSENSVKEFWSNWFRFNRSKFLQMKFSLMEEQPYSNEIIDGIPTLPANFYFKFLYIEKEEDGWGEEYLWNLRDKYREVQQELKEYLFTIAKVAHMKNRGEKLVGMFDGGIAGMYTERLNQRLQNISTACHINGFQIKKFYNTFDSFLYNELVEFLLAPEGRMACNVCGKLILYPHRNQLSYYKLEEGPVYCRYEGDEHDRNSCWRISRREKSRESKAKSRAEKNKIGIPLLSNNLGG